MRVALLSILALGCGGAVDSGSDAGSTDASQEPAHKHSCRDDLGSNVTAAPAFTRVVRNGSGIALAVDRCGNTYVTGSFTDTLDAGDGPHSANGKRDVFLLKLDASGKTVWTKTFGGSGDEEASHIAIDDEDDVVLAGASAGGIDFGGGPLDAYGADGIGFLARIDGSGAHIASKGLFAVGMTLMSAFGGETYTLRYGLSTSTLARHSRTFDIGWTRTIQTQGGAGPTTLLATQNGVRLGGSLQGALRIEDATLQTPTNTAFTAMVGSSGDPLWVKPSGCVVTPLSKSSSTTRVAGLGFAHDGGFFSTGEFSGAPCDIGGGSWTGTTDPYVARHDANGSTKWVVRFPSSSDWDTGTAVAEAPDGNVVVSGGFSGTVDFGDQKLTSAGRMDAFLVLLDPTGKTIWSRRFGGTEMDFAPDVKVDETGAIFTTGYFHDDADFGEGPVHGVGNAFYVLKVQP